MSNTINIPCAIFKSISTFKKLMFEILETDHKELDELFNKRFPNNPEAKKPFRSYNGKSYIDVTLNKWQTSDTEMMKLQNRIDQTHSYFLTVKPEFYSFKNKEGSTVEGLCLKFVKMI